MKAKKMTVTLLCLSALILPALAGCTNSSSASTTTAATTATSNSSSESFFTTDTVHSISIDVDDDTLKEALEAYQKDGSKNWIEATVTIDGQTFKNVGLKLKGNSTLKSAANQSIDDINAEELPWIIRLDKYEDGQSYLGRTKFVVRGNNTESSLNEAVALAMLNESGLDAEDAAFTRFSVNGSDESLRLVIDVPDDDLWTEDHFGTDGLLYKAQSDGDYSYQGTDAASYEDSFEQKYGDDDMTPLITFLDFVNNSTDEEFSEKLSDYLDVDEFATYLAMQDLVANDDDIDGPGNNAYLYYDSDSKKMTVVAWDQNLSFGGMGGQGNGGGGGPMGDGDNQGGPGGDMGTPPDKPDGQTDDKTSDSDTSKSDDTSSSTSDKTSKEIDDSSNTNSKDTNNGQQPPQMQNGQDGDNKGGMNTKDNALVTRFLANETFSALVDEKKEEYTKSLIDSNYAEETLASYKELLTKEASDLIDEDTLTKEAETISNYLSGDTTSKTTKNSEDTTAKDSSTKASTSSSSSS